MTVTKPELDVSTLRRLNVVSFAAQKDLQSFGKTSSHSKLENGNTQFSRVPAFRSGAFRDSWGDLHTWEDLHMQQMVMHFNHLKETGIFADVPLRDGHPGFFGDGGSVIGYITNLAAEKMTSPIDGKDYTYLLADYEVTEPEAAAKIERGTFRNRSSEIGVYVTNDEAEFWPVFMGLAYVDIPAVEGLQFSKSNSKFSVFIDRESSVGDVNQGTPGLLIFGADNQGQQQQGTPATPVAVTLPSAAPAQAPAAPSHEFSVNGQKVSDFSKVQEHINSLEQFAKETEQAGRDSFVDGLVSANKVMVTQADALKGFAKSLSAEQFTAWKAVQEGLPSSSILANHAAQSGSVGGENDAQRKQEAEEKAALESAKGIYSMHKASGMSAENLKNTASYKSLVAAGVNVDSL